MSASPINLVLTAYRDGRWLAIPASAVGRVGAVPCTPAPPWSLPWVDGLALMDGHVVLAIAPYGSACEPPPTRSVMLVLHQNNRTPRWALAVDRIGALTTAEPLPSAAPASAACPRTWLRSCRLADGRSADLVDPEAIQSALSVDGERS